MEPLKAGHSIGEKAGDVERQTEQRPQNPRRRFPWVVLGLVAIYEVVKWTARSHEGWNTLDASFPWVKDILQSEDTRSRQKLEELYLSIPDEGSAIAASRAYATHPHLAASKEDFEDAKIILKLFQDEFNIAAPGDLPLFPAGSEQSRSATLNINKLKSPTAWIDIYYPVMNTPLDRTLQILDSDGSSLWDADLVEDGDPLDPEAAKYKDYIPTWHGLSRNGTAEGEIIYVNYGTQEDYNELVGKGTNFTGKIALARYGAIFRGLKIKGAQELGAAGVLIYSDPRDDGYVTVENGYEPYPAGPARNPTSVQRGSVQFISLYPGDPTTPGYPAYENSTRTEGENIPKIPSLPISWANAQRLLEEISEGKDALTLTGKASERKIKLVNHVDDKVMPIYNTMAVIPGHIKNESVIIGCHRDAWVMGAADPISGTVSLHEVIRGYGALLKSGWKPLRNIVIASWDAEEYGLVGSTEWAEDFAEWITNNAVAYVNNDVSAAGSLWGAAGSPSLAHLIREVAQIVPHPTDANRTLWDAREDWGQFIGGVADADFMATYEKAKVKKATDTGVVPLGSGSDFTVFLQRLGIASMDQSFVGTPTDAVYHYHSIYDSERWEELYADPGFHRHVAVAKHMGLVTLRLTDSIIVPLNTTQYALELGDYLDEIEELAASLSLDDSVKFSPLRRAIGKLQHASSKLDHEKAKAEKKFKKLLGKLPRKDCTGKCAVAYWIHWLRDVIMGKSPIKEFIKAAKRVQAANAKLVAFEKGFIDKDGIKDREWYRHLGVAPGKWLGYGATTLPSIYDALVFEQNATFANAEVERVTAIIKKLTKTIQP